MGWVLFGNYMRSWKYVWGKEGLEHFGEHFTLLIKRDTGWGNMEFGYELVYNLGWETCIATRVIVMS